MKVKNQFALLVITIIPMITGCICLGGGELKVKKNHVFNKCGLLNGVYVTEIQVDSFENGRPVKYQPLRSTLLFRRGATPIKDPKKLYFKRDEKEFYLHHGEEIIDTVKGPMAFKKGMWYSMVDDDSQVFMVIEKSGKRKFITEQKLKVNY